MMSRILQCQLCGGSFVCRKSSGGCWCANVRVPAEALKELEASAKDCVCPKCLDKFARKGAGELRRNVV
jgi:hypothetical protein